MTTTKEAGVATVYMNSPPVNTMDVPFFLALTEAIAEVEKDKSVHSLILASSQKVYSAGLDLNSMYGKTQEELRHFWTTFRNMWIALYKTRLMTVPLPPCRSHCRYSCCSGAC
jgi:enoyl-CoA hydratase/carnithine racemase